MAANSKREQIISAIATTVENISSIKSVQRRQPEFNDLQSISHNQMPFAAVTGLLPKPEQKYSKRQGAKTDLFVSKLKVDIFIYAQEKTNPDTLVSNLADDVWAALYADESIGGLALGIEVDFDENVGYWNPFIAFKIIVTVGYQHKIGGI